MAEFDKINLVWRKGAGEIRHAVGILEKLPGGMHVFNYLRTEVEMLQKNEGFSPYTEFQDLTKSYNGNVAEVFGQRLTRSDRPDVSSFYKFWEVDEDQSADKFYLLGKTQGLVPTDNFEFLAEYKMQPGIHFLTELAGLSYTKLSRGELKEEDELSFKLDSSGSKDPFAVKVFKGDRELGYIKRFHNRVFYEEGAEQLKLKVKAMEQNGTIKRVFVKVSL
jgi:hypothetical protein